MSSTPLVTVVIPSAGRRGLLDEAVASCLDGMGQDIEIVVVPNGPVAGDVKHGSRFADDCRVRFEPIHIASGNAARNHGVGLARGRLVRFLDDDDYLVSEGARQQYEMMAGDDIELSTGAVDFVDSEGRMFSSYHPSERDDLPAELFYQRGATLTMAHVYIRSFLKDASWSVDRTYLQDVAWMHALVRRSEVRWRPLTQVVGAWRHHDGPRVSAGRAAASPARALEEAALIILDTIDALERTSRMTQRRRSAAAKALWDYAHQGFVYSSNPWTGIARRARDLDLEFRPRRYFYHRGVGNVFDPVFVDRIFGKLRALYLRVKP